MDAHGIPQVSQDATGIHLSWTGPGTWVHAPDGFTVQRRVAERLRAEECEQFDAARLARLADLRELPLIFGVATLHPLAPDGPGGIVVGPGSPLVVLRIDLDEDRRMVRVVAEAAATFAVCYCEGRVVAVGLPQIDNAQHTLRAPRIDGVDIVVRGPKNLQVCVDSPDPEEAGKWANATTVAAGLTLPLREVRPDLATSADELAEARRRLLPGETLGEEEFDRLTRVLRPVVAAGPALRPADLVVLLREEPAQDPDEVRGLDPLRMASAHPTWRRALGLGLLDDDPGLVPGETYEYRISATYPGDLRDPAYDFAAVPSGTLLPADFAIGGLRVRLPRPTVVRLAADPAGAGAVRTTRRGIALDPARESFWLHPSLDEWSLVLDFPTPVTELVLDLAEGHDLVAASGPAAGLFDLTTPVPAGLRPRLVLPAPADQVRLRGTGFLHGLRAPAGTADKVEVSVVLAPITLTDTPLPGAPRAARAINLQQPVAAGPLPTADVAARHDLGFRVSWRPALAFGLPGWLDQLDTAGPLEATTFEVERRREPDGPFTPVHDDENRTLGERGGGVRDLVLTPGTDLRDAFPEDAVRTSGADDELTLTDTFAPPGAGGAGGADVPEPGTLHRYRVRAVDAIGRPGSEWRETDAVRLEKHRPPPLPVAVETRVLVRDADDLTPDERTLLGSSGTAILLRWTWPAEQRDQDPFATEFRVYVARPLDRVTGTLDSDTSLGGGTPRTYRLLLTLDRPVTEDLVAGGHLDAGHPFLIRSHTAGTSIEMMVETRLQLRDGTVPRPVAGPIELAVPLNPDRTRPDAWDERVEVQPIGAATAYQAVLRDRLLIDEDTPFDALWVGVSAADDQEYVTDQRAPAETRPGNESAVVPAQATARYAGRPTLEIPPPLEPVPQLRTPEPGAEPVHFPLDLLPHLPAAATSTGRVRVERVSAVALASALAVTADDRVLALPVEPDRAGGPRRRDPAGEPRRPGAAGRRAALRADHRGPGPVPRPPRRSPPLPGPALHPRPGGPGAARTGRGDAAARRRTLALPGPCRRPCRSGLGRVRHRAGGGPGAVAAAGSTRRTDGAGPG